MPFVSMSDSLSAGPSTPARLAALAIRPNNTLAPTAVPPARKARRPIAGFEITLLFRVPKRTCSDLISEFLSVRFIEAPHEFRGLAISAPMLFLHGVRGRRNCGC